MQFFHYGNGKNGDVISEIKNGRQPEQYWFEFAQLMFKSEQFRCHLKIIFQQKKNKTIIYNSIYQALAVFGVKLDKAV